MDQLTNNISSYIDDCMIEINHLMRIITHEYNVNQNNFKILAKYYPSLLFSIWEGFFKNSMKEYFLFINRYDNISKNEDILINIIEHNNLIHEKYENFNAKKRLVNNLKELLENPKFNEERPHIKLSKINTVDTYLSKHNLDGFNTDDKHNLNRLIMERNRITHWDNPIPQNLEELKNHATLIIKLIQNLEQNIRNNSKKLLQQSKSKT